MARCGKCDPAIIGLEGRGSRFVSSRLSRTLISARPPRGTRRCRRSVCARCPVRWLTAERPARVAPLGRVFHQVGPCELLDTTPDPHARFEAVAGGGHVGPGPWDASSPALEIRDQLRPRLVQVGFVDNTVAIKDGSRLVPGQDHGDAFRDPRADQIARRRPPAIMQEPARGPPPDDTRAATRAATPAPSSHPA